MPNPKQPYLITLDATTAAGDYLGNKLYIRNLNTGDVVTEDFLADGEKVVYDLNNTTSGYTNGDLINVQIVGREYGGTTHTVDTTKGGATLTITGVADTSVAISI